jgi:hypothetical protein
MLMVIVVRVSESPVCMTTLEESCMENPNVPELEADQKEISVSVSGDVPAQLVQAGAVPVEAIDPPDDAAHVTAGRVVTLDTLDVPAAPGAPVCSCTLFASVPVIVVSAAFATAVDSPSAIAPRFYLLGRAEHPRARPMTLLAGKTGPERIKPRPAAL